MCGRWSKWRARCASSLRLLLLDEPSSGLNPEETEDVAFWIEDINQDFGATVIMVEHDMHLVSDRIQPGDGHGRWRRSGGGRARRDPGLIPKCCGPTLGTDMALLEIRNIETYYGPVMAIKGVSLEVREGQVVSLLGANGAGKTTVLKTISGAMDPQKGSVSRCAGEDDPVAVIRTKSLRDSVLPTYPRGREVFPVSDRRAENLNMGALQPQAIGKVSVMDLELVYDYFPALRDKRRLQAGYLSGGQQQMLAIGRALMLRPADHAAGRALAGAVAAAGGSEIAEHHRAGSTDEQECHRAAGRTKREAWRWI